MELGIQGDQLDKNTERRFLQRANPGDPQRVCPKSLGEY